MGGGESCGWCWQVQFLSLFILPLHGYNTYDMMNISNRAQWFKIKGRSEARKGVGRRASGIDGRA